MKGQKSFHARRSGWCRGCQKRYTAGTNVWSPAKGGGAFHVRCQPAVTSYVVDPARILEMKGQPLR